MMAIPKEVILPEDEEPVGGTAAQAAGAVASSIPSTYDPGLVFGGDRGEEEYESPAYIPEEIATNWASSFALPKINRSTGISFAGLMAPGGIPAQPTPFELGIKPTYEVVYDASGKPTGEVRPITNTTNPQTLIMGKEKRGLGWNFDLESQPPQTYSGDLTFGGQGKGKGLTAGQQAYADQLQAQYINSIFGGARALGAGGMTQGQSAEYARLMAEANRQHYKYLNNNMIGLAGRDRSLDWLSGQNTQQPKTTGGGSASKKYYYGGGGGGGRGYSSYSSPASWFNALLSWRI